MKLYLKFFEIHLKSAMQYKVSFLLTTLGQFLVSFNTFLGIYFMMHRFHNVKGFTYSEVLMCFSINIMAFTTAEMFARGFDLFPSMISNGEFDRVLVRPKGLIFQVLASKMEFTRIGRMLQAVVLFIYAVITSEIDWNVLKIITIVFMLLGGVCLFSLLFLTYASVSFFTIEGIEFMNVFTDGAREYGRYPIAIYGKTILKICTFIVPFALFQYYPLLFVLGRTTNYFYIILPLLTSLFGIPSLLFWKFGVKHYKSTGS